VRERVDDERKHQPDHHRRPQIGALAHTSNLYGNLPSLDLAERLVALLDGLSDRDLRTRVPACPLWSVHDLVAHLCGVAEDSTHGRFFAGAAQAWADPELAAQREAWTAGQVEARRGFDRHQLVAELERHGCAHAAR
jgi:hypothetical protein